MIAPGFLLAGAATIGLAAGIGGWKLGTDHVLANETRVLKAMAKVEAAAQKGAAEEIAKIRVTQTTIRQQAQKEIIREPIYLDCRHPEPVLRLLDAALTQTPIEPAGNRELPATDSPF